MGEMLAVWMVLVPIAALLTPFVLLPRFAELRDRQEVRLAAAAGLVAVLYITNTFSVASYTRAAMGTEAIRLIPLLQFDSTLLTTTWIPDQIMIGATYMLFMSVIFSRNLRNAFWVTFVLFGVGIEWNQALANMSGITPPFRIDAHDIAMRTAGIALALQFVQRLRGRLIAREQILRRASAAPAAYAPTQAPSAVLMIRPHTFQPNPETAADNAFQSAGVADAAERTRVAVQAQIEVAAVAAALRGEGVGVVLFEDREGIDTPDSVFPNNWISTHEDGRVVLYPMATTSRRRERRGDVVEGLRERFKVSQLLDLSPVELEGRYLEGTGALVLDHVHRIAYMARSGRANEVVLDQWCEAMGYSAEVFDTVDQAGQPIYHTNVVLSIATDFVVAGLDNIPDPTERARIAARLGETGRDVIKIDQGQVAEFAGNGLELNGSRGHLFVLSTRALTALRPDQIAAIETSAHILAIAIPTIERSGGSVRCMLAGIHLPPRQPDAPTTPAA
ncbi:MAG: arginine deiminase-related protein [Chloroflexi bacterium]|nr:arginine deiminase-related protein [Chloroflexota bacterium]